MLENLAIDLYELNLITITVRVFLSIILGGIIGTERDIKNRAAGVRTHMLVCLGAAVVMLTNQYVVSAFPDLDTDITRMGAQVISGIGFLGAGTILITGQNQIQGLTTAAGLWASATIGLAIGIGFYEIALVGFLAILFIVFFLKPFKTFVQTKTDISHYTLLIHLNDNLDEFFEFTSKNDIKIINMSIETDESYRESLGMMLRVTMELGPNTPKEEMYDTISSLKTVSHIVELAS